LKKYSTLFLLILITISLNAQNEKFNWEKEEISTKSNNYSLRKSNDRLFINNLKFKENETAERKQYDPSKNEFSSVKLHSHDGFLKIFTDVFESKRIKVLANFNERIVLFIRIDENAQVIDVGFALGEDNKLTIEEIEKLEKQVLNNLKFDIVGKKLTEPIYYAWSIRVNFKEVEKGEIEFARKSENYTGR